MGRRLRTDEDASTRIKVIHHVSDDPGFYFIFLCVRVCMIDLLFNTCVNRKIE